MAVHTFKDYTKSINRFSPDYNDPKVQERMAMCLRPIHDAIGRMLPELMLLDMFKAFVFYNKPVHECLSYQMADPGFIPPASADLSQFMHGLLGILTECNEAYMQLHCEGLDKINGIGEVGDLLWFVNELSKSMQVTLAEAAAVNEAKLSTRYGDAHDCGKAINRDKAKEEAAMQTALEEVRAKPSKPEPKGWREKFEKAFVMSGANSNNSEMLFRVWGNGTMSIALPEHLIQFIEVEILGEYDPNKDEQIPYTVKVFEWAVQTFGRAVATDIHERCCRFLEESLELVQANGLTQNEAHHLVDYVFERPQGDINQEVGGVLTTLHTLCAALRIDPIEAGNKELTRCWELQEKIRIKHNAKPKMSPLPGPTQPAENETNRLLAIALSPLEDAGMHNASKSQRVAAARIREIIGLKPRYFKHGTNYDGHGNPIVGNNSGNRMPSDSEGGDSEGTQNDAGKSIECQEGN